ncbi:unnamed protein product [Chrysodeixis includens]|uniref:Ribonuclease P protein subunit p29 n=1 Tax=Chrysodeixis includens TaxID=689277 RepID=A0A9N8KVM8_CHRIL|nr:unnamed protein product [Chrysodeixis includens]
MSSEETFNKGAAEAIVGFLNANVAKSGIPNIESELKKDFVLAKKRSKDRKKRSSKKKVRCLTRAEKKELGFYAIPRHGVQYKDILPLNQIWLQYISDVLELDNSIPDPTMKVWENFTQTLYKADFHGSYLKVIRSKCPSLVDKSGICIMDTKNTFKIVSENNITCTIPKRDCVFEIDLQKFKVTLFGKLLCARPAERSTKKLKGNMRPDL